MRQKKLLLALGLLLLAGVLFFLKAPQSTNEREHTDVVITLEKLPPKEQARSSSTPQVQPPTSAQDPELEDFREELSSVLAGIATVDSMAQLSDEEVHHTPTALRENAEEIAGLIEKADASPKLRSEAMSFLQNCAEADTASPTVRALCWKKIMNNIPKWKIFVPVSELKVSQDIKDLAAKL